ncbi:FAD-dependent thymidylate synthase [Synechococcus virus S-ESS1]|uniref:FAD-dependent thymidylate synthase n=1 Tax=Synechococcus virus S-ESS1 TaxID=1964565 RepID=A0A1V0DX36_9CAUD|nr:FAD-dependent thymidylate synthase [Synechococcus virus S-ESS1]ARB05725.1 FAD-dependent thymidylate synthase [Synechococcus virus S-ESS1]
MRPNSKAMDAEIASNIQHKVLDHGMIRVVDYMGNDASIVQAARVSYGDGTKTPSDDRSLIRYLMRHRHTTPFEMCEVKLHVKLPIFVARQWIRHRTASVNEYSARYSILANEFYIPEARDIQPQSKSNHQGRGGKLPEAVRFSMVETIRQHSEASYQLYEELFTGWPWFHPDGTRTESNEPIEAHDQEHGMARELARMVVPPNIYTEWYWKVNLHNLLHFLSLRADPHAQMEIRAYAEVICDLVRQWCPVAFEAFEDYRLGAETFSRMELEVLRALTERACAGAAPNFLRDLVSLTDMSAREQRELLAKLEAPDVG